MLQISVPHDGPKPPRSLALKLYQYDMAFICRFYAVFLFILIPQIANAQRAPDAPYAFAGFLEPDFPFTTTTLNAGALGPMYPAPNLAVRCIVLQLENDAYACFDTDLLRVAATWTGDAYSLVSMPQVSYHKAGNKTNGIPEVLGAPVTATGIYPGWQGANPAFADPRPVGPNPTEIGRGPIDASLGRWQGLYVHENSAVLQYEAAGTSVNEMITSATHGGQTGIMRTFRVDPHPDTLTLVVGEFNALRRANKARKQFRLHHNDSEQVTLIGVSGVDDLALELLQDRFAIFQLPPSSNETTFSVTAWTGAERDLDAASTLLDVPAPAFPDVTAGSPARWADRVYTAGRLNEAGDAFALDILTLPMPNPWRRNVRASGIDFFPDGRAAISTFEGDVWLVSNIDAGLENLTWKRYASGLCEPMSLSIVDGQIYTFGREGIVRLTDLNGDEEADYYENFSNLPIQTGESREFPLSMHALPDGGFILSKGAALNAGPKTHPAIMDGLRAGGPHSGSILRVSADGRSIKYIATGLREPYASVHPETGWITASDQQGNFVPSTPIYFVEEGDYYGVPATAHRTVPPAPAAPLTWVPHQVDRSSTEQVWITSDRMGPLNGALVHLSYGKPGIYRVYYDKNWQGGISPIPIPFMDPLMKGAVNPEDGQLYLAGFQVWDSDASDITGLSRVRYTGGYLPLPRTFEAGRQGIHLRFDQELDPTAALDAGNYTVERWNYARSESYGSGHFQPSGQPGHESVRIDALSISEDNHGVFLHVADIHNVMQMGVDYRLRTAAGDSIYHNIYFTIHTLSRLNLAGAGFADAPTVQNTGESAVAEDPPNTAPLATASAVKGKQIYQQMGCIACHSSDGTSEGRSGPTFKGLYGSRRTFNDGTTAEADEAYIRESILDPGARVVSGKEVEMPSYVGILSETDMQSLILFIKSITDE